MLVKSINPELLRAVTSMLAPSVPDLNAKRLVAALRQFEDTGDGERYLRTTEIAKRLGITRQMVSKLISQGKLRAVMIGTHYRISERELARYIDEHTTIPA